MRRGAHSVRYSRRVAKRQVVSFIDDLDGRELDIDDAHTISWSWSGVEYQIDVSSANLDKIENGRVPVARLLEVSTRVGGRKQSTAPKVSTPAASAESSSSSARPSTKVIREWAQEAGYEVPLRGRLPKEILDAYDAAH
ncbi:histone-like nucleoid-structuring protein Lsr2 [Gordonia oryzae]|uniref:histone-like nucleoid-structuring protein Lsr2 n=1 Tax=Gordonia oryzae TaxID=2487349 RepID=UPI002483289B|nr:Lsr2 family protein [Gordonia oryzae]